MTYEDERDVVGISLGGVSLAPAPEAPRDWPRCAMCGRAYSPGAFRRLLFIGHQVVSDDEVLELRSCCGSTIGRRIEK